jgi:hypothetical protein
MQIAISVNNQSIKMVIIYLQQRYRNRGAWYGRPPYGDDPHDQFWIKQGIDYAREQGY